MNNKITSKTYRIEKSKLTAEEEDKLLQVDISDCPYLVYDESNIIPYYCNNMYCTNKNCYKNAGCTFRQIALKDSIIEELQQVNERFRQYNDRVNEFLNDLGIASSAEMKRIHFYMKQIVTKNKNQEKLIMDLYNTIQDYIQCKDLEDKVDNV